MQYKDKDGNIVERKTMVDVVDMKQNNQILMALTGAVYIIIMIVIWVIWKVLKTGAVNTYIARCVG